MASPRRSITSFVCDFCHESEPQFICLDCRRLKLCIDCRAAHETKEKTHFDIVKMSEFTLDLTPEQIKNHKRWRLELKIKQEEMLEKLMETDKCKREGVQLFDQLIDMLNTRKEDFTQKMNEIKDVFRVSIEETNAELIEHEFDPSYEPESSLSVAIRQSIFDQSQPVPQIFTYAIDQTVFADALSVLEQIHMNHLEENRLSVVRLGRTDFGPRINGELEEFKRGIETDLIRLETIISECVQYLYTSNSCDKGEWVRWTYDRFQQRDTASGPGWDQIAMLLRYWTESVLDAFNIGRWRIQMNYELAILEPPPVLPSSQFSTHLLCLSGFFSSRQSLLQMSVFPFDCVHEKPDPSVPLEQLMNIYTSSVLVTLPSGNVLLCGGGNPAVSEVFVVNVRTGRSRRVADMKAKRRALGGIFLKNSVFVFGGSDKKDLISAEMFLGEKEVWADLPNMLSSRCMFNPCAHQDLIYLCGGHNCARAETFDISTQLYHDLGLSLSLGNNGTSSLFVDEELVILQDGLISRWKPESGLVEREIGKVQEELFGSSPLVVSGQFVYLFNFRASEIVLKVDLIEGVTTKVLVLG